jgi:DNA ligase-1
MKLLPKLYKRTSTGKIQEWYMEVEGNKYRTISGQTDGKKVVSAWTECVGKNIGRSNETTPEEQAMAEAVAKREKKLEKEYKELVDDIDVITFQPPMLANSYDSESLITFPVYVQPKLDGVRCIAKKEGLFTRNGKPIVSCPHINDDLAARFRSNPLMELDGELYNHDLKDDFDSLISVIKKQKPVDADFANAKKLIQYHIYDVRDPELVFSERLKKFNELVKEVNSKSIIKVTTRTIKNKAELDAAYDEFLSKGYEGEMIRTDTPYEFKRTNALLKRKEFMTDEFEIVDIIEGKGNRAGMAGRAIVKLNKPTTEGETTCEAGLLGGFKFFTRLLKERKEVIGKLATIEFQNYTPKGSLRFPRMITVRDYE